MSRITDLYEAFEKERPAQMLGAKLELLDWHTATVSAVAREDFVVFAGCVQGGLTAVIADYAAVFAAMSMVPSGHCPAENINIDYLRPVKEGDKMIATAMVEGETRSNLFTRVRVMVGDKLVAVGTIKFAKPKP
jgi:uncharacterized protein (TIGR00369 family)